jgi:DNA modification methylase
MPLSIAQFLVERLSIPAAVVSDPMSGSGTTLLAAKKTGRVGIGFDLDPLAVILSRVTTSTVDLNSRWLSARSLPKFSI